MADKNRFSDLVGGLKSEDNLSDTELILEAKGLKRGTEKSIGKSRNDDYTKLTVYIPKTLARKLKARCAYTDIEMSTATEQALSDWLNEHPVIEDI